MNRTFFTNFTNHALPRAGRYSVLPAALMLLTWCLSAAVPAYADSQLGCLEKARGKIIDWDARWGAERQDEGVSYEVVDVAVRNRLPDRSVTLTLKAEGKAVTRERTIKVESEDVARRFCERLHTRRAVISTVMPEMSEREFIQYSPDGWVRALPPPARRLSECVVGPVIFSCTEEDRMQYGTMLKDVEAQVRWLER